MSPTLAVSPLSPERAWASQRSWTERRKAGTRERFDGPDLFDLLPAGRRVRFDDMSSP
jgi:hypothetical protein